MPSSTDLIKKNIATNPSCSIASIVVTEYSIQTFSWIARGV